MLEYAKYNFVKKCPNCSIILEKKDGCNHITLQNVNMNGVGYLMKNMNVVILIKENVKDFNISNLKMNMK